MLIERSVWGSTVESAASDYVAHRTKQIDDLSALSQLMIATLPAALPNGIEAIAKRLEEVAALAGSIPAMMEALPPLVNALTYGDVRNTAAELIQPVVDAIVPRIYIGLLSAVSGLDRKGSETFVPLINGVHSAIRMLEQPSFQSGWISLLQQLAGAKLANGLLSGRAVRLLFDGESLDIDTVAQYLSQTTSKAIEPDEVVDWLDGFLEGSGLVLVHHAPLLALIDRWLSGLPESHFIRLLPLIRRAFNRFTTGERFQIGQLLRQPKGQSANQAGDDDDRSDWLSQLDSERAGLVLPTLKLLLGVD